MDIVLVALFRSVYICYACLCRDRGYSRKKIIVENTQKSKQKLMHPEGQLEPISKIGSISETTLKSSIAHFQNNDGFDFQHSKRNPLGGYCLYVANSINNKI